MDLCTPSPDRRFHASEILRPWEAAVTTALCRPHCYQITTAARALAMCGAVQRDTKAKGHIPAVPGSGRPRPRHPTRPSGGAAPVAQRPGRRWWARREAAAAFEPGGAGLPESLAQQHGQNSGSACSQDSRSGAGPRQPPYSLAAILPLPPDPDQTKTSLRGPGSAVIHRETPLPLAQTPPSARPTHQHRPLPLVRHCCRHSAGASPAPGTRPSSA